MRTTYVLAYILFPIYVSSSRCYCVSCRWCCPRLYEYYWCFVVLSRYTCACSNLSGPVKIPGTIYSYCRKMVSYPSVLDISTMSCRRHNKRATVVVVHEHPAMTCTTWFRFVSTVAVSWVADDNSLQRRESTIHPCLVTNIVFVNQTYYMVVNAQIFI